MLAAPSQANCQADYDEKKIQANAFHPAKIARLIVEIDRQCQELINNILHHPAFQQLEASWRNLYQLTRQTKGHSQVKIRCLNISWHELGRDLTKVVEYNQTEIFNKIYNQEFGMPGGEPFGLMIGDYAIDITNMMQLQSIEMMSNIAAVAFVPFIAALDPKSFGLTEFAELPYIQRFETLFKSPLYQRWRNLRQSENARFIGLVLPNMLARAPYQKNVNLGMAFSENAITTQDFLWGHANYAFANMIIKSYIDSSWFINLKNHENNTPGGLIDNLPILNFDTDALGIAYKLNTSVMITDQQERQLSEAGFIPLCQLQQQTTACFYDNNSIQLPKKYTDEVASTNAKIATNLQYMLCASRFAHYLKIIGRDKMGSFLSHIECENYLNDWLIQYIAGNEDLSTDQKLNYPLRDGKVKIKENPGKPGHFIGLMYLQPRMHLEQIKSMLILVTELSPLTSAG